MLIKKRNRFTRVACASLRGHYSIRVMYSSTSCRERAAAVSRGTSYF